MENFAVLIQELETSNKTNDKIDAIVRYLEVASDKDKVWLIALFTGRRPKRPVKTSLMRAWALEITGLPEWLFLESYSSVGDLGETLSLILPKPTHSIRKSIHTWITELIALQEASEEQKKEYVLKAWSGLDFTERFIFNKLIGGGFRIGVSHKLLVNALAKYTETSPTKIMHNIMGNWHPSDISFGELVGEDSEGDFSKPYPFCLAYPIDKTPDELGPVEDWQAEWKWDGIRGQLIKRNGEIFIWSRGEELVTQQFPEITVMAEKLPDGIVLDGEILAVKYSQVLPFNHLQKRLNRKTLTKKMLEDVPVGFYAYDLLEYGGKDYREHALAQRRKLLEEIVDALIGNISIFLSPVVRFDSWDDLTDMRSYSREMNSEGIMLKHVSSPYHTGRKKGDWWKWKVEPYSIDAVLIYAQKGSGRRSYYYTDYTFAVRDGEKLVTIAKAYSGLTDQEIKEVDKFVKNNSIEKFGPVRTVKPELVFEIGFEGIAESNRHKAGIAVRFPRILRWRHDKKVEDVTTIEEMRAML